jgi:hypothetical protein
MQLARRDGVTRMVGQSRIERSYDAAMTDKMFGDHRRGAAAAFHAQMQRAHAARLEGAEDGTIASADGRDPLPELVMAHGRWWEETHPQHQLSKFLEGACRMAALVTQTGLELDAILLAMLRGARE